MDRHIVAVDRERARVEINGLPGLMQLPVLGTLFKSRDYINRQTELMILVTPFVVGSSILLYICGFRGPGYSATPATGYTELIDTTSINPPNAEVAVKAQWAPTTTSAGTITKSGASTDIVYHIPLSPA